MHCAKSLRPLLCQHQQRSSSCRTDADLRPCVPLGWRPRYSCVHAFSCRTRLGTKAHATVLERRTGAMCHEISGPMQKRDHLHLSKDRVALPTNGGFMPPRKYIFSGCLCSPEEIVSHRDRHAETHRDNLRLCSQCSYTLEMDEMGDLMMPQNSKTVSII